MENTNRSLVLERLHELEGWAEYIVEALHLDQRLEPVKREMLERVVEMQALKQLREMSWCLRDKLHIIATQVEFSRPAAAELQAAPRPQEGQEQDRVEAGPSARAAMALGGKPGMRRSRSA